MKQDRAKASRAALLIARRKRADGGPTDDGSDDADNLYPDIPRVTIHKADLPVGETVHEGDLAPVGNEIPPELSGNGTVTDPVVAKALARTRTLEGSTLPPTPKQAFTYSVPEGSGSMPIDVTPSFNNNVPLNKDEQFWNAMDVAQSGEAQRPSNSAGSVAYGGLQPGPAPTQRDLLQTALEGQGKPSLERSNVASGLNSILGLTPVGAISDLIDFAKQQKPIEAALAATGAVPAGALSHAIFLGPMAANVDRNALATAQKLAAQGVDRNEIWQKTMWAQTPGGQWYTEHPDAGFKLAPGPAGNLRSFHPEIEAGYPGTYRKLQQQIMTGEKPTGTFYREEPGFPPTIDARGQDQDQAGSIALHETQHLAQANEGFSPGANPLDPELINAHRAMYNNANNQYDRITGHADNYVNGQLMRQGFNPNDADHVMDPRFQDAQRAAYDKWAAENPNASKELLKSHYQAFNIRSPQDFYEHNFGEAMARAAQERQHWPMEMRRQNAPFNNWKTMRGDPIPEEHLWERLPGQTGPSAMAQPRQLNDVGLYSHGEEAADALPQAKGSPQQFKAMLQKAGVKPAEFENSGFDQAFAGRNSVTREEVAQHFRDSMPKVEENVLGGSSPEEKMGEIAEKAARDEQLWKKITERNFHEFANPTEREDFLTYENLEDLDHYVRGKYEGQKPPKFESYALPGGQNYREVLLKLPAQKITGEDLSFFVKHKNEGRIGILPPEMQKKWDSIAQTKDKLEQNEQFNSSHWDDPNVLAHLRLSDRTGPNNEKILHMEELQSDWGQKGRKEGFKTGNAEKAQQDHDRISKEIENWRDNHANDPNYREKLNELIQKRDEANARWQESLNEPSRAVPPAPYVTNTQAWTDLGLKRALKEAAEGGYDRLTWTPGIEQAKRYDLSKQISEIRYSPQLKTITAYDKNNRIILNKFDVEPKKLADLIGKEPAEKLINSDSANEHGMKILKGDDLSIGGEGMKSYYDKIVPTRLKELTKKLGGTGEIEPFNLTTPRNKSVTGSMVMDELPETRNMNQSERSDWWRSLDPDKQNELLRDYGNKTDSIKTQSIRITPEMRARILKGQTAFALGGRVNPALSEAQYSLDRALSITSKFSADPHAAVQSLKRNRDAGKS